MFNVLLQSFSSFTQAEMIFLGLIIFALIYASITLRSFVSMFTTVLAIVVLIGVMRFNVNFDFFWYMLIFAFISISVSVGIYTTFGDNV